MFRAVFLYLLLIVAMGQEGLTAFSIITGLDIYTGHYDFQTDHVLIHAYGKSPVGVTWRVKCRWEHGLPRYILYDNPEIEL